MSDNEMIVNDKPEFESRLLAALSHGSIFLQGAGIIVGVVVYLTQRDRSKYAAFQALQAAVFQLISMILVVGMWIVWTFFYMLSLIPVIQASEAAPNAPPPPIFWVGMGSMVIPFMVMIVIGLYGLWAAFRSLQGKDFRYLIIGSALEKAGL
ncbi:MAG: DUF4870 domain-containing protein [Anaerolineae bacterium]|nr:DUF4870 domain-containing protein [Anaerolineae bacterium]